VEPVTAALPVPTMMSLVIREVGAEPLGLPMVGATPAWVETVGNDPLTATFLVPPDWVKAMLTEIAIKSKIANTAASRFGDCLKFTQDLLENRFKSGGDTSKRIEFYRVRPENRAPHKSHYGLARH
jgi:hypothetical protein